MPITYEVYRMSGAPTLGSNTIDEQVRAAELYLVDPAASTASPPNTWTLIKSAGREEQFSALFRDADRLYEIALRATTDGAPASQGTRIGQNELRRVIVRSGWSLYVRAAA